MKTAVTEHSEMFATVTEERLSGSQGVRVPRLKNVVYYQLLRDCYLLPWFENIRFRIVSCDL